MDSKGSKFYERMDRVSKRLTNSYGVSFDIVDFDSSNNEVIVSSGVGLKTNINKRTAPDDLIDRADYSIVCRLSSDPDNTHYLRFDGELFKIIDYRKVEPVDDRKFLYRIFVKK